MFPSLSVLSSIGHNNFRADHVTRDVVEQKTLLSRANEPVRLLR